MVMIVMKQICKIFPCIVKYPLFDGNHSSAILAPKLMTFCDQELEKLMYMDCLVCADWLKITPLCSFHQILQLKNKTKRQ